MKNEAAAPVYGDSIETVRSSYLEGACCWGNKQAGKRLFSTALQAYGYKVILAEDGEKAIKMFVDNKDKIQLVMLDMIMPKMSGKAAYDRIKK